MVAEARRQGEWCGNDEQTNATLARGKVSNCRTHLLCEDLLITVDRRSAITTVDHEVCTALSEGGEVENRTAASR